MTKKFTTGRMIDGLSCHAIDMVIENLDLEPRINAIMRDFLEKVLESSPCFIDRFIMMLLKHQDVISEFGSPPQWEELSKETHGETIPSGDGSCG
ncbi:hypothetical protein Tco_0131197, partial [Tanacetum coccineum]